MNEAVVLNPSEVLEKSMHEEHEAAKGAYSRLDTIVRDAVPKSVANAILRD